MKATPPEGFFDACALSCLIFYRSNGLHASIQNLLYMLSPYFDITRINAIMVSDDLKRVIHIYDTKTNTRHKTVLLLQENSVAIIMGDQKNNPIFSNDLDKFKKDSSFNLLELKEAPFWEHRSILRIPLFIKDDYIFLFNFWSNNYDAFTEEDLNLLTIIIKPLAEELKEKLFPSIDENTIYTHSENESNKQEYIKNCPELSEVYSRIKVVAPTKSTVLILGESGTGKEIVADAIYNLSNRKDKPFIKINCSAITPSLLNSELFGHEKGAFTGAWTLRKGYFEHASGGTLFLDEIGNMPQEAQVSLLRVLGNSCITRVGDHRMIPVDVRIIAASQTNLLEKIHNGEFRRDLWFRLAVFPIILQPLRARRADIPYLIKYFIQSKAEQLHMDIPKNIPNSELERLYAYDWPGNVRELEFVIERSLILYQGYAAGTPFHFELLPELTFSEPEVEWPSLQEWNYRYIRKVLEKTKGKLTGPKSASEILGIHYTTLRTRMREMGIPLPHEKNK